ncbi:hypothetical protein PACTADRAFT_48052 [Pachysolen tannophilus NRRL Y-2460]|uniref:ATP synthase mitochondrial F1 complex assembly factor 2 n=1 Tax=Pachysolen tannophilus NRRL Y-2460 TaxID=669874 RepID=A0A1E4U2Y8_PACTA|nr:hypothetical protein PACTADRAFT_48052 [Pachysolen tannophilus NRRL Y-2460]
MISRRSSGLVTFKSFRVGAVSKGPSTNFPCAVSASLPLTFQTLKRYYAKEPNNDAPPFPPKEKLTQEKIERNVSPETKRLEKNLSKFWEKVGVEETDHGFEVQLDNKTIKTPLGNPLVLPKSKKTLAHLIAVEWKHLPNLSARSFSLPLTSTASRAIDLTKSHDLNDPDLIVKVGRIDDIKEDLLRYLDTDTLLVFSPALDCDGDLRPAQEKLYRPIIKSMEDYFAKSTGKDNVRLSYLDSDKDGLVGNVQTEETKEVIRLWMSGLNMWQMVALEKATLIAKSFLAGAAIIRANEKALAEEEEGILTIEEIAQAATLETIYQTKRWGEVEDTHDVDKVDVRRNLASASLIAYES